MTRTKIIRISTACLLATSLIAFNSCRKKDCEEGETPDFDRGAMLANYADNLIIPAYQAYQTDVAELQSAVTSFTASPSQGTLDDCRTRWRDAVLTWQWAALYRFGPAESFLLQDNTNIYPTDTTQIGSNIIAGSYNLGAASNIDAKGLPALDFLLHGVGSNDSEIIQQYVSDASAANRVSYLTDLVTDLKTNIDGVVNEWTGAPNYRGTFVANTGTEVGSSVGLLLNGFNLSFESHTRADKLGTPAGALTFSQTPLPTHVEAYWEGSNNVAYLIASLEATQRFYWGMSRQGSDGIGLDDYLIHIDAQYNGSSLDETIDAQLVTCLNAAQNLPDPLGDYVVSNQAEALATYAELQLLVVLFKVDMMSSLGVLISYQDNDGD